MTERVKFGYLLYNDMLAKIETGEVNEYDVIYTKDRLLTYLISEDLKPIELRSRVYVFNSITEAETALNNATDTYVGQVVAILYKDKYRGYIVNYDETFTVSPLWENPDIIDYNTLGNRPIENLVGTLSNPIFITTLLPGIYKIKGQYKIDNLDPTTYLSADGDLFLIGDNCIKRITKDTISNYVVNGDSITSETYITDEYLTSRGYVTTDYVDTKVKALEESIKADIEAYVEGAVEDVITEKVDVIIDERLDAKLEEKIQPVSSDEVTNLFS